MQTPVAVSMQPGDPNFRKDESYLENITKFDLRVHPVFAMLQSDEGIFIRRIHDTKEILDLDDATPILALWPGKWDTDHWFFIAEEVKAALTKPGKGL